MKNIMLLAVFVLTFISFAQAQNRIVPEPQRIAVDSRDNVYVTLKYGLLKIAPDGTVTDLSKLGSPSGILDQSWKNLVIDSKDNLYLSESGETAIYKVTVSADNKVEVKLFAGELYNNKLKDGPAATAGFNVIDLMTIDANDNIYVTSSYDWIRDEVGSNFITDDYYWLDRNSPKPKNIKKSVPRFSVIRKIAGGVVTTLKTADGKYILPHDMNAITTDNQGNIVYSAGGFSRFIGKIDVAAGKFSLIAGQPYKREWCPVYTQGHQTASGYPHRGRQGINAGGRQCY
jgi:hypothetical protein